MKLTSGGSVVRNSRASGAPTIADVARFAGVSPMTVSRVLNGSTLVRDRTAARVKNAVVILNYQPNQAARILAGNSIGRIGLLCNDLNAGFLSAMLVGCLDEASRSHAHILIENSGSDDDPLIAARALIRSGVDGILLPPPLSEAPPVLDLLDKAKVPTLSFTAGGSVAGALSVHIDDRAAAKELTHYLIEQRHRRIGFILGRPTLSATSYRLAGYKDALREAGIPFEQSLVAQGFFTYRSGLDAAAQLLALTNRPTAIVASNDDMAAATIALAQRNGLHVPADLSVCGFDDTELATAIWPELTTIRQPVAEMSRVAIRLLLRTARVPTSVSEAERRVQFAHTLVRRHSVATINS